MTVTKKTTIKTTVSILIGLTWVASQGVGLAQTTYQHIVIDPNPSVNGSTTLEKALVDINGDGKLDLVLGEDSIHGGPGGLYWYEAPSSGNLSDPWIRHTIASRGRFYEAIAISDVNGDGAPDIIASVDNKLVWFENPSGHKTFFREALQATILSIKNFLGSFGGNPATYHWPMHVILGSRGVHEIVLGDIDGDGKTDIICSGGNLGIAGSHLGRSAVLFQNTPDSWTEVRFGTLGEGVALLDIGAGIGRINIAGGDGNNIVWYENPRESGADARRGAWIRHVAATLTDADDSSFASGVFSSSGRMDLIVASNEGDDKPPGLYRIIAPADRRSAWTLQTIDSTYQAVHKISLADMNNDGRLDFVISEGEQAHNTKPAFNQNFNNQRVAVFYNDGDGNFTQQVIATTGGHNQVVGDVMGNGILAILSANHHFFGAPNPLELWVRRANGIIE